jgi:hypothetical protein
MQVYRIVSVSHCLTLGDFGRHGAMSQVDLIIYRIFAHDWLLRGVLLSGQPGRGRGSHGLRITASLIGVFGCLWIRQRTTLGIVGVAV